MCRARQRYPEPLRTPPEQSPDCLLPAPAHRACWGQPHGLLCLGPCSKATFPDHPLRELPDCTMLSMCPQRWSAVETLLVYLFIAMEAS